MKYRVAKVSEILPGERVIVDVAGRSVGVFNIDGEFFALRNQCPHAGAPVCKGSRSSMVSSTGPGHYECSRPGEILRCPWHDWEFDIRTGKSVVDPERIKISAYPTEISAVEGAGHSPPTGFNSDGMPFELETYPVSIDERYVVLEI